MYFWAKYLWQKSRPFEELKYLLKSLCPLKRVKPASVKFWTQINLSSIICPTLPLSLPLLLQSCRPSSHCRHQLCQQGTLGGDADVKIMVIVMENVMMMSVMVNVLQDCHISFCHQGLSKVRDALPDQIVCFFEHCSNRGGGSNPCSKILLQIWYNSGGYLAIWINIKKVFWG